MSKRVFILLTTLRSHNRANERSKSMKTKCILEFNNMPQNAGTNDTTYSIHTMNFRVQLTKRDKVVIEKKLAVLSKNYGVRYFSKKEAKDRKSVV